MPYDLLSLGIKIDCLVDEEHVFSSDWARDAARINDAGFLTLAERMQKLQEHWKKLGEEFSIRFINVPKE